MSAQDDGALKGFSKGDDESESESESEYTSSSDESDDTVNPVGYYNEDGYGQKNYQWTEGHNMTEDKIKKATAAVSGGGPGGGGPGGGGPGGGGAKTFPAKKETMSSEEALQAAARTAFQKGYAKLSAEGKSLYDYIEKNQTTGVRYGSWSGTETKKPALLGTGGSNTPFDTTPDYVTLLTALKNSGNFDTDWYTMTKLSDLSLDKKPPVSLVSNLAARAPALVEARNASGSSNSGFASASTADPLTTSYPIDIDKYLRVQQTFQNQYVDKNKFRRAPLKGAFKIIQGNNGKLKLEYDEFVPRAATDYEISSRTLSALAVSLTDVINDDDTFKNEVGTTLLLTANEDGVTVKRFPLEPPSGGMYNFTVDPTGDTFKQAIEKISDTSEKIWEKIEREDIMDQAELDAILFSKMKLDTLEKLGAYDGDSVFYGGYFVKKSDAGKPDKAYEEALTILHNAFSMLAGKDRIDNGRALKSAEAAWNTHCDSVNADEKTRAHANKIIENVQVGAGEVIPDFIFKNLSGENPDNMLAEANKITGFFMSSDSKNITAAAYDLFETVHELRKYVVKKHGEYLDAMNNGRTPANVEDADAASGLMYAPVSASEMPENPFARQLMDIARGGSCA